MIRENASSEIGQSLKWIARIGSLFSITIIGLFAFGGNEPLQLLSLIEAIGFACFPVGVMAGILIGWEWPLRGGLLSLGSLLGFYVWHFVSSGSFPSGPWFAVFAMPLFFFIASAFCNHKDIER